MEDAGCSALSSHSLAFKEQVSDIFEKLISTIIQLIIEAVQKGELLSLV